MEELGLFPSGICKHPLDCAQSVNAATHVLFDLRLWCLIHCMLRKASLVSRVESSKAFCKKLHQHQAEMNQPEPFPVVPNKSCRKVPVEGFLDAERNTVRLLERPVNEYFDNTR